MNFLKSNNFIDMLWQGGGLGDSPPRGTRKGVIEVRRGVGDENKARVRRAGVRRARKVLRRSAEHKSLHDHAQLININTSSKSNFLPKCLTNVEKCGTFFLMGIKGCAKTFDKK